MITYFSHMRNLLYDNDDFNKIKLYEEKNRFKYLKTIKEISDNFSLSINKDRIDMDIDKDDSIYIEKIYFVDIKYNTAILFKFIVRKKNEILSDKIIIPSINKIYTLLKMDKEVESVHNQFLNRLNVSLKNQDIIKHFADSYQEKEIAKNLNKAYAMVNMINKQIPLGEEYYDYIRSICDLWEYMPNTVEYFGSKPTYWDDNLDEDIFGSTFDPNCLDITQGGLVKSFDKIYECFEENIILDPEIENVLNGKYKTIKQVLFNLSQNVKYNDILSSKLNLKMEESLYDFICPNICDQLSNYLIHRGMTSVDTDFSFNYNFKDHIPTKHIKHINRYNLTPIKEDMIQDLFYLNFKNISISNMRAVKTFQDIMSFDVDVEIDEDSRSSNINTVLDLNTNSLFSNSLIDKRGS